MDKTWAASSVLMLEEWVELAHQILGVKLTRYVHGTSPMIQCTYFLITFEGYVRTLLSWAYSPL